jgi:hypothetical protein
MIRMLDGAAAPLAALDLAASEKPAGGRRRAQTIARAR